MNRAPYLFVLVRCMSCILLAHIKYLFYCYYFESDSVARLIN
jgi:hypothetical protein